jgi:surface protein
MFSNCESLTSLDLSGWDTSRVTSMVGMFNFNSNLEKIYVSNNFIVDQVLNSDNMFNYCEKLVGGNGTVYDSSYIDKEYARIDTSGTPGYFSVKTNLNNNVGSSIINTAKKIFETI